MLNWNTSFRTVSRKKKMENLKKKCVRTKPFAFCLLRSSVPVPFRNRIIFRKVIAEKGSQRSATSKRWLHRSDVASKATKLSLRGNHRARSRAYRHQYRLGWNGSQFQTVLNRITTTTSKVGWGGCWTRIAVAV